MLAEWNRRNHKTHAYPENRHSLVSFPMSSCERWAHKDSGFLYFAGNVGTMRVLNPSPGDSSSTEMVSRARVDASLHPSISPDGQ